MSTTCGGTACGVVPVAATMPALRPAHTDAMDTTITVLYTACMNPTVQAGGHMTGRHNA